MGSAVGDNEGEGDAGTVVGGRGGVAVAGTGVNVGAGVVGASVTEGSADWQADSNNISDKRVNRINFLMGLLSYNYQ